MFQCIPCQWRNLHVQWWAHWLLRCWIGCVWVTVSGTAGALEELEAPLCDPAVVASGGQIECERPRAALPPELPASSGEAPMCDETGASIGVRTPVPELDRGRLEALPCEAVLALFGGKSLDFPRASARLTRPEPAPAGVERSGLALEPRMSSRSAEGMPRLGCRWCCPSVPSRT
ncbi:MAG: hypothetical protein ABI895_09270 [Deltaproteobacteria bacterium]